MNIPKLYAEEATKFPIDMTLSTNPLGCSPRVQKSLRSISQRDISEYPDSRSFLYLLSKRMTVQEDSIVLGNGSEQLIKLIAGTFIKALDTVSIQTGTFGLFTKECILAGARVSYFNPLKSLPPKTARVIFLCNPINPTGEILPKARIDFLCNRMSNSIIVIDEANGEYMNTSSVTMISQNTNIIVLRTLSKVLGLAGLRIGFACGSVNIMRLLRQSQQPFPVSSIAIKLAISAIADTHFIKNSVCFVRKERGFLQKELSKRGIRTVRSVTNNLFVCVPRAQRLIAALNANGVGVVNGNTFPGLRQPGFRISIKDKVTNRKFLTALDQALSCIDSKNLVRSKGGI